MSVGHAPIAWVLKKVRTRGPAYWIKGKWRPISVWARPGWQATAIVQGTAGLEPPVEFEHMQQVGQLALLVASLTAVKLRGVDVVPVDAAAAMREAGW